MKKVLEINKSPEVRTYQTLAYPLTIMYDSDIRNKLLLNHYIQVNHNREHFNFYDTVSYHNWYFDKVIISEDIINTSKISIIDILKNYIIKNYYIVAFVDEYYIPERTKKHFIHDILIYGFDEEQHIFNAIGYTEKGEYKEIYININDLTKSLDKSSGFTCVRPLIDSSFYNIDLSLIHAKISDYVKSENTYYKNIYDYKPNSWLNESLQQPFGIDAFNNLENSISELKYIHDIKDFRFFFEHKHLMLLRIKYLLQKNIINCDLNILNIYSEIENDANIILKSILKMQLSGSSKTLKSIIPSLKKIKRKELEILPVLLREIETYVKDNDFII